MGIKQRLTDALAERAGKNRQNAAAAGAGRDEFGTVRCAEGHPMSPVSSLGYKCYECDGRTPPLVPTEKIK